jgi:molybdate transport system ATP-binding protein
MNQMTFKVDFDLQVSDGKRKSSLAIRFATAARLVVLFGPSGCGKSLSLRTIAGLTQPARGHISVAGQCLFDSTQSVNVAARFRGLGYVPQHYALFPHLSVAQNISFALSPSWGKQAAARNNDCQNLMQRFGLSGLGSSKPANLSGGQQQRVALARAMMAKPQALLLDEPLAALNPQLRRELRQELKVLAGSIPVLMVSHDPVDVLSMADEVFFLEQGQVTGSMPLSSASDKAKALAVMVPGANDQGLLEQRIIGALSA